MGEGGEGGEKGGTRQEWTELGNNEEGRKEQGGEKEGVGRGGEMIGGKLRKDIRWMGGEEGRREVEEVGIHMCGDPAYLVLMSNKSYHNNG